MHIRETLIAATVAEGELFVVDAHLMQQRGVDVVDAHGVAGDGIAEVIGLAEGYAVFESTTSHEDGVTVHMMIAA